MPLRKLDWKSTGGLAVGKGATLQEFVAFFRQDKLEIDVAPWGEGHLKVNGRQVAHVNDAKDRRQAFRELRRWPSATCRGRRPDPTARGVHP